MKADYWRQGVATILTAGLLAVGAAAQDGAEGEVNITDKAPTETSETASVKPAEKPVKPQIVDRDPFVNQLTTGTVFSSTTGTRSGARVRPKAGSSAVAAADDELSDEDLEEEEEEIPAPEVSVKGIVSSGSGRQAIISTSVGTRMITTGQKLGDYRVSSITAGAVTFTYGGTQSFKIPLDSEF